MKIDKKIVNVEVVKPGQETKVWDGTDRREPVVIAPRPEFLSGGTYKIKSARWKHSFYLTINDRAGKPFEVFINSENEDTAMWTKMMGFALTAIMREAGDIAFLLEKMEGIVDPRGGHFAHHQNFKSIVAEIGYIIKLHIDSVNGDAREGAVLSKKAQTTMVHFGKELPTELVEIPEGVAPLEPGQFTLDEGCPECPENRWRMVDGCPRCEGCSYSKCS